jgi:hypothetical protein
MTTLLIHSPDNDESPSDKTMFGGKPSASSNPFEWPKCQSCQGNMQFLGQIQVSPEQLLLLFMCQNKPGTCDEWDPNLGGNKVVSVGIKNLQLVSPPDGGETLRPTRYGAALVQSGEQDYDEARTQWASASGKPARKVLGQIGGEPSWLQNEETPTCSSCSNPMQFFAQLEQGPDWQTEMNFGGGGCTYIFRCTCAQDSAKLLWQC